MRVYIPTRDMRAVVELTKQIEAKGYDIMVWFSPTKGGVYVSDTISFDEARNRTCTLEWLRTKV